MIILAWDDLKKNICVLFMNVVSLVEYGYLKNDEDNGFVIADIPTASASLPQSLLPLLPKSAVSVAQTAR
jgi:hypothetical protein